MTRSTIIPVRAPDGEYPIFVGAGWLNDMGELLLQRNLNGKVTIVTNTTLAPLYGEALRARLPDAALIVVPDGEQFKTLDTVRAIYDGLIEAELDRKGVVIALGGGVVGDMVGFAAATYLRGVAFVQVPTSLLAMVDSSVGGKVGVDVPQGKNLIGAFKQPSMVVVDTDVLRTLPDAEWRCGVAEVVKAGLIRDPWLLDAQRYERDDMPATVAFITRAIRFKADIVEEDPYENGVRAFLNLGHTFGHAIERVSQYRWRHGDAVSVGLLAAVRLSQVHGLCSPQLPYRVESLLRALNMPVRFGGLSSSDIRAAMNTDKKRQGSKVRFVLLRDVGDPLLVSDVPDSSILAVLESLRD